MDGCPRCGGTRSDEPGWCALCFTPREPASDAPDDLVIVLVTRSSHGDDGDLSFPFWMRIVMSAAILAGGVLLFRGFETWWNVGRPVLALGLIMLIVYGCLGGIFVARLWAPATFGRRREHMVALDRETIREVEERQRALVVEAATPAG